MTKQKIMITGAAGFIGSHLMSTLLETDEYEVYGIDNFNNHLYDPKLKVDRMNHFGLYIENIDIRDRSAVKTALIGWQPDVIIHLAAHAGVRDSFGKEQAYHSNNIDGTQNLIECIKEIVPESRVIYASTSGVYGSTPIPEDGWNEDLLCGKQLNAYTYTKYINEIQFQISGINNVGLRFFTVYGSWGRPDMALLDFTKNILAGNEIEVFNYGKMKRDFTHVFDIIDGILEVIENDDIESNEIFNIGRGEQVNLLDFVEEIEYTCGVSANIKLAPKHPADTLETFSNTSKLGKYGYEPQVSIREGVEQFYEWYRGYYVNVIGVE